MEKSKAIFGVSTDDVIKKIKIDSSVENKSEQNKQVNQKVKSLVRPKIMRHNTKNK